MPQNRISRLDGWRAICCLGVLWIHCWHLNSSSSLNVFGINFAKPLSLLGNGVDFFFAISGFCMYYFYLDKINSSSVKSYTNFIIKRAKRIIPAYYFFAFSCLLIFYISNPTIPVVKPLIANILFLQTFSKSFEIISHLWSIAVEWHFYLIFPLILIFKHSKHFLFYFIVLTISISILGIYLLFKDEKFDYYLPVRFVEFAVGIIVGYFLKLKTKESSLWLVALGVSVLFLGRLLITDSILQVFQNRYYYSVLKLIGYTFISGGFSILLYCTLLSKRTIFNFLNNKVLVFVGKISYSFYLWHGITCLLTWQYVIFNLEMNSSSKLLIHFGLSLLATLPIAYFSYKYIEQKFI